MIRHHTSQRQRFPYLLQEVQEEQEDPKDQEDPEILEMMTTEGNQECHVTFLGEADQDPRPDLITPMIW